MAIVFTAAIMDVFHNGHKNIISLMKEKGTAIVVLHSDEACYRIKGKMPIHTLEQRIRNAYIAGADIVLPTYETDPADQFAKIIEWFPHASFIRGDDNLNPPGKWILDQHNISQEYIPYTEGISSSQIRKDICNS